MNEMTVALESSAALNAICPYFTMFPLRFPYQVLSGRVRRTSYVLDPFCGRGTTNFAARLLKVPSCGIDSNPVAAAIAAAKLVSVSSKRIVAVARELMTETRHQQLPSGEFWRRAYHPAVLDSLTRLRCALNSDCSSASKVALRGIILGALHGPINKSLPSYFSNQCTRTYAPKPRYAANYWRSKRLSPPKVDLIDIIRRRAERYYDVKIPNVFGYAQLADSRDETVFSGLPHKRFDWVITSPPYYGMRTYIQDQWLRNWFLGGSSEVDYSTEGQVNHFGPLKFIDDLRQVWDNIADVCVAGANLVVRFGGISDRGVDPLLIIKGSLNGTRWRILTVHNAGTAEHGKRQANSFLRKKVKPLMEFDVWARLW